MLRRSLAGFCSAISLLAVGPAKADLIQVHFSGFLAGVDSLGILGAPGMLISDNPQSGVADVFFDGSAIFDTSLGNLQTVPIAGGGSYQMLSWTTGQGASPLQSVSVTLRGEERSTVFPFNYGPFQFFTESYASFTSFSASVSPFSGSTFFQFSSSNGDVAFSTAKPQPNTNLDFSFNQGFHPPPTQTTSGGSLQSPEFPQAELAITEVYSMIDLGPSPVPEPDGWILLMTGCGILGAGLRRFRARSSCRAAVAEQIRLAGAA
jgi:hypothetical protein